MSDIPVAYQLETCQQMLPHERGEKIIVSCDVRVMDCNKEEGSVDALSYFDVSGL
jgi:hypothetical protein